MKPTKVKFNTFYTTGQETNNTKVYWFWDEECTSNRIGQRLMYALYYDGTWRISEDPIWILPSKIREVRIQNRIRKLKKMVEMK